MERTQKMVERFVKARGWDKEEPDHVVKSISIESAELLELFQWGSPTVKEIQNNPEKFEELKGELADVLIYSFHLLTLKLLNYCENPTYINPKL